MLAHITAHFASGANATDGTANKPEILRVQGVLRRYQMSISPLGPTHYTAFEGLEAASSGCPKVNVVARFREHLCRR